MCIHHSSREGGRVGHHGYQQYAVGGAALQEACVRACVHLAIKGGGQSWSSWGLYGGSSSCTSGNTRAGRKREGGLASRSRWVTVSYLVGGCTSPHRTTPSSRCHTLHRITPRHTTSHLAPLTTHLSPHTSHLTPHTSLLTTLCRTQGPTSSVPPLSHACAGTTATSPSRWRPWHARTRTR